MSSYLGSYPAGIARALISMLSEPGDIVMDPFSGRGTTLLEARLLDRAPLASDLNPIAFALSRAKNTTVTHADVMQRVQQLRGRYDANLYRPEAAVQNDDIRLIFHPHTLAQLCFLRRQLLGSTTDVDKFLVGVTLGVMHGSEKQNGSSSYLSISMPNTFSMSPAYVQRFVETNSLDRVARDTFAILGQKVDRLFRNNDYIGPSGTVAAVNARELTKAPVFAPYVGQVSLIVTSPPYLDVVDYSKLNWIRNWFVDGHGEFGSVEALDDDLTLREWLPFAEQSVNEMKSMLRPGGVIAMVVGDVVRAGGAISLAREFMRQLAHQKIFEYVGCLSDHIQSDVKTTRIWKDTKGRATNVDRIVVLSDESPTFRYRRLGKALFDSSATEIAPITATQLERHAADFMREKRTKERKGRSSY
jgi:site-specific DNA-methyltransferase (adenine-specific)